MAYIGIDLHSNKFTLNSLGKESQSIMQSYFLDKYDTSKFIKSLSKNDYVAIEASTNTFSFYDLIKDKVKEVHVVNPLDFHIINNTSKKTDKVDAKKLAKMLKYHVETGENFLPEVYVPEKNIRKLRGLFTTYMLYKKQITGLKNRVHSILKENLKPYNGENIFTDEKEREIMNLGLDEEYLIQLKSLYESINHLKEKKDSIKKEILYAGRSYKKEIEIMTSISGISVFAALAVKSDYADIKRFKNAKHFTSYLRAVPRVNSSNDKTYIGKTQKRGRKLSITLLLQSICHFRKINPNIESFYQKKIKGKSKGKVRMAIARKTFVAIYYMLRDEVYYTYKNTITHQHKMKIYGRVLKKYEEDNKNIKE